jgi:hypothetical protein
MKFSIKLLLIVAAGAAVLAQNGSDDNVTIKPTIYEARYCLGPTSRRFPDGHGPSDITLWLWVQLDYENHGSVPIIVPLKYHSDARMVVAGETETVKSNQDRTDFGQIIWRLSRPEPPYFMVIPAGASQYRYLSEFVSLTVKNGETDLLGKTVTFVFNRDHRRLAPKIAEQLQNRWKTDGQIWLGAQDSELLTVSLPIVPKTVDCALDEKF